MPQGRDLSGKGPSALIKVLTKHYESLVAAGSDHALLEDYLLLLNFLRSRRGAPLRATPRRPHLLSRSSQVTLDFTDSDIANLPVGQIVELVSNEMVPRSVLEKIAIHRFKVPRGSMRSFSNRRMLEEKIFALVRNEQAHATIDSIARGQKKIQSESGG